MQKSEIVVELKFVSDQPFQVEHFPREGVRGSDIFDILRFIGQRVMEAGGVVAVSRVRKFVGNQLEETYGWNHYAEEGAAIDIPMTALGLATPLVYVMFENGQTDMAYQDNLNRWRTPSGRQLADKVVYWKKISGILYDPPQQRYEQVADENQKKEKEGEDDH